MRGSGTDSTLLSPAYSCEGGFGMRVLGRTGVHVSPLCLGTMMFGAWGNRDHDESIRIISLWKAKKSDVRKYVEGIR